MESDRIIDDSMKHAKFVSKPTKHDVSIWYINSSISHMFSVLKLNVISKAKGSAYIEMGNTKVIVSVFDPREIPNKQNNFR